ncbi:MAG: hypothetical protein ABEJ81_06260 [Haloferacaceae archaeon]
MLGGYSFVVLGGTGLDLALVWIRPTGRLASSVLLPVGLGAHLLLAAGGSVASYRYARRRYRRYVLD